MAWVYKIGVAEYFPDFGTDATNNATLFYDYFYTKNATLQATCGMLGNIMWESRMNPGCKQSASTSSGWGLIMWTPSSVLTNWCNQKRYNWYDGAAQCERIWAEGNGDAEGVYWIPTQTYPYTWSQFLALTDVDEATKAFLYERERAGDAHLADRLDFARRWYQIFIDQPTPPQPPVPPEPYTKPRKMAVYMMLKRKRRERRL